VIFKNYGTKIIDENMKVRTPYFKYRLGNSTDSEAGDFSC
jgi:hypothetical protein